MHGGWITDHLGMTLYFWIFVVVVGMFSWKIFRQMKDFFADHL
jgi:hypothetical protein